MKNAYPLIRDFLIEEEEKLILESENGEVEMIRRAETLQDYFATLNFPDARLKLTTK